MPKKDHADLVVERLNAEQSLKKGSLGAFVCGSLGVALAHGVALSDINARVTIATAFIGALTAFGMRQWGRGIDRSFRLVSLLLTAGFMYLSIVLAGCIHRAKTSRFTFDQIVSPSADGFMSMSFAWGLFREALNFPNIALLVIGLAISWFTAHRRLSIEDLSS